MWLDSLVKKGIIKEAKKQHRIRFILNGVHLWDHLVDFMVTLNDGRVKYAETKGFQTVEWKRNHKLYLALGWGDEIPYLVNPNERQLLE